MANGLQPILIKKRMPDAGLCSRNQKRRQMNPATTAGRTWSSLPLPPPLPLRTKRPRRWLRHGGMNPSSRGKRSSLCFYVSGPRAQFSSVQSMAKHVSSENIHERRPVLGPLPRTHTHTPRAAQHARPSMSGSLYRLIHSPLLHGQLSISMRTGKEQKKASPLFASELATRCPHGCTWAHTHGIAPSPQLRNIRRHSNVVTVLSSFRPSKET